MKTRIKDFIKSNLIYVLSFGIPFIVMLILFIASGIYPFGDGSFLHIDLYHQYYPFLREFNTLVSDGSSLLYSWNAGLGSNFITLFSYYLSTPTNLLSFIFPESLLIEFISYVVIFKIGAAGWSFSYLLTKKDSANAKDYTVIFFSVCYALSGFMAAYNWDVMWLDVVVLAPLTILGLERLVKEGKPLLYCITLGVSIFTNYYLSIMLCIFLVLYFIVLFISAEHKFKAVLRFGFYSLISGGLAGAILLPTMEMLLTSEFGSSSFPSSNKWYFNFFEALGRMFPAVTVETGLDHWPNIYCGLIVLLLIPIYIFAKKISLKEKIPNLLLLAFIFISFGQNRLTFIWHGFNYPDSLPARQSYLFILLALMLAYEGFKHIKELKPVFIWISSGLIAAFAVASIFLNDDDAFEIYTFAITGGLLIVYIVFLIKYRFGKYKSLQNLYLVGLFIIVAELSANTAITSVPIVDRPYYISHTSDYTDIAASRAPGENEIYRIEKKNPLTQNDAMMGNYNSATLFSSTQNSLVTQFYERYGLRSSKVFYSYQGATPLMAALLNVHYVMNDEALPNTDLLTLDNIDPDRLKYIYKNNYPLNFGYMVPTSEAEGMAPVKDILETAVHDCNVADDPLTEQINLTKRLGATGEVYVKTDVENEADESKIEIPANGYYYAYARNTSAKKIRATDTSGHTEEFAKLSNHYILDLGYHAAGDVIVLESDDTDTSLNLVCYRLNLAAFGDLIDSLNESTLEITHKEATNIKGSITANEEGYLVLSIPYEKNWTLYVDGKETEPEVFEDVFIATKLTAGDHEIEVEFTMNSLKYGILLSIGSIIILVIAAIINRKFSKKAAEDITLDETD